MPYPEHEPPHHAPPGAFFMPLEQPPTGDHPPFFYPPELLQLTDELHDDGQDEAALALLDLFEQTPDMLPTLLARAALLAVIKEQLEQGTVLPLQHQRRLFNPD